MLEIYTSFYIYVRYLGTFYHVKEIYLHVSVTVVA